MIQAAIPNLVEQLREVVGSEAVLSAHSDVMVYECDGFVIEKSCPDVVVLLNGAAVPVSAKKKNAAPQTS